MSGEALARGGHVTWRWADSSWKGEEMDQEALEREDALYRELPGRCSAWPTAWWTPSAWAERASDRGYAEGASSTSSTSLAT